MVNLCAERLQCSHRFRDHWYRWESFGRHLPHCGDDSNFSSRTACYTRSWDPLDKRFAGFQQWTRDRMTCSANGSCLAQSAVLCLQKGPHAASLGAESCFVLLSFFSDRGIREANLSFPKVKYNITGLTGGHLFQCLADFLCGGPFPLFRIILYLLPTE